MANVAVSNEGNRANKLKEKTKYYFIFFSISEKKNYVVHFKGSVADSQAFVVDHQDSVVHFKNSTD